jgi:hypothetical protein
MTIESSLGLGMLLQVEHVLDMMPSMNKAAFLGCTKENFKAAEGEAWDEAEKLIKEQGSLRKASNGVRREIDKHRGIQGPLPTPQKEL